MNLIIPMAGLGTRLRPHTLITPKPLIKIYGKPIIVHIISEISNVFERKFEEIAFIIGEFGIEIEKSLLNIAKEFGAIGKIYYQQKPLGTAHAVSCAGKAMKGPILIAFADTLFKSKKVENITNKNIIWVKEVDDPSSYGVVTLKDNIINRFVEKPKTFISNKAIIGLYFFNKGEILNKKIKNIIKEKRLINKEYQLTDALEELRKEGIKMNVSIVSKWLDCGNKKSILETNSEILNIKGTFFGENIENKNSKIIDPCYIGDNVKMNNAIIGPYASIENDVIIKNSEIKNSMIMMNSIIENCKLSDSIIGKYSSVNNNKNCLDIGDYSTIK